MQQITKLNFGLALRKGSLALLFAVSIVNFTQIRPLCFLRNRPSLLKGNVEHTSKLNL